MYHYLWVTVITRFKCHCSVVVRALSVSVWGTGNVIQLYRNLIITMDIYIPIVLWAYEHYRIIENCKWTSLLFDVTKQGKKWGFCSSPKFLYHYNLQSKLTSVISGQCLDKKWISAAIAGFFFKIVVSPSPITNEKVALRTVNKFIKWVYHLYFDRSSESYIYRYGWVDLNALHFKIKYGRCKNQSD